MRRACASSVATHLWNNKVEATLLAQGLGEQQAQLCLIGCRVDVGLTELLQLIDDLLLRIQKSNDEDKRKHLGTPWL